MKDLTQEFFTRLLNPKFFKNVRVEKSLRNFLKVACRNHYLNWRKAEQARQKKESDAPVPEEEFFGRMDEEIRASYLEEAMEGAKRTLLDEGKEAYWKVFEARVRYDDEKPTDYKTLSRELKCSVVDVRNYLAFSRKVFREVLMKVASEHSDRPESELRELDLFR